MKKKLSIVFLGLLIVLLVLSLFQFGFLGTVKAQEPQQNTFGNPSLPNWRNITVTVAGDSKSFTLNNVDNLTWIFPNTGYAKDKYPSIYQSGVQIVKDELWMLQVYDGNWKDIGSSVNVFYEQIASYNVRVTQLYSSVNGGYNVTWNFYGGFRPKITLSADIVVAGNYRVDWRTYVYKDYAVNMTNYVKFWNGVEEAVVFDYSDVYMAFGNITSVEGVEGWVKGKRFDLVFNVGSLPIGVFRLDPNFGYETQGSYTSLTKNYITGSRFACSEAGTANNITWYISTYTNGIKCKFALYKVSDNSLVAYTEEFTVSDFFVGWKTLNVVWGGTLEATNYWIVIWANSGAFNIYYATSDYNFKYENIAYNSFPNPWSPTDSYTARKFSSYCTYTVAGGQEYSRSASQSLTLSLVASKLFEITRPATQAISIALTGTRLFDITRMASQGISIGLVTSRIAEFARSVSQTININFVTARIGEFFRSVSQTITTTLSVARLSEFFRSASQTITLTLQGIGEKIALYFRDAALTITTTLNANRLIEVTRQVSQTLNFIFNGERLIDITRTASQTLNFVLTGFGSIVTEFERFATLSLTFTHGVMGIFSEPVDLALVLACFAIVMAIVAVGLVATKKD